MPLIWRVNAKHKLGINIGKYGLCSADFPSFSLDDLNSVFPLDFMRIVFWVFVVLGLARGWIDVVCLVFIVGLVLVVVVLKNGVLVGVGGVSVRWRAVRRVSTRMVGVRSVSTRGVRVRRVSIWRVGVRRVSARSEGVRSVRVWSVGVRKVGIQRIGFREV